VGCSPKGELLALERQDASTFKIHRVAPDRVPGSVSGPWLPGPVFSPDGKVFALCEGFDVRLFDARTGEMARGATIPAPPARGDDRRPTTVAFTLKGTALAYLGADEKVWLWPREGGAPSAVESLGFSPVLVSRSLDGKTLVAASKDGRLSLIDLLDETVRVRPLCEGRAIGAIRGLAISADATLLAVSQRTSIALRDAVTGEIRAKLRGTALGPAFSPDGKLLAAETLGAVQLWDVASARPLFSVDGHRGWVRGLALSPDGTILASGGEDGIRLWDLSTAPPTCKLVRGSGASYSLAFSPDGRKLVSTCFGPVVLVDVATAEVVGKLEGHTQQVWQGAFSPDGDTIASVDWGEVRIWSARTGKETAGLKGSGAVAFSPDGKELAAETGGLNGTVALYDLKSLEPTRTLSGHKDRICGIAYSPDGKLLASGSEDMTVRLWEPKTGKCLQVLNASDRIYAVAFSRDGKLVAAGGWEAPECSVRVWKVEDGSELAHFSGHSGWVGSLAFSADGKKLYAGNQNSTILVWDLRR